jgi:hypothetical protein
VEKRSVSQAEFEKSPHEAGFTVMLFWTLIRNDSTANVQLPHVLLLILPRLALACNAVEKRSVSQAEFEKSPHEVGIPGYAVLSCHLK